MKEKATTSALTVASRTAPPVTWRVTDRPTGLWLTRRLADVLTATRCTCPCRRTPCTSVPTARAASVPSAESVSPDRGYSKVTSALTQVSQLVHLCMHISQLLLRWSGHRPVFRVLDSNASGPGFKICCGNTFNPGAF